MLHQRFRHSSQDANLRRFANQPYIPVNKRSRGHRTISDYDLAVRREPLEKHQQPEIFYQPLRKFVFSIAIAHAELNRNATPAPARKPREYKERPRLPNAILRSAQQIREHCVELTFGEGCDVNQHGIPQRNAPSPRLFPTRLVFRGLWDYLA